MLAEFARNKNKLRGAAKSLTLEQLLELQSKLAEVVNQRKSDLQAEKANEIAKLKQQMEKLGITAKDLSGDVAVVKKARKPRKKTGPVPPKYRITVNGQTHEWTGRGRTPKVFDEYFAAGNSRQSCEI